MITCVLFYVWKSCDKHMHVCKHFHFKKISLLLRKTMRGAIVKNPKLLHFGKPVLRGGRKMN